MPSKNLKDAPDQTREKILTEAEALFADKGYHAVSVREITRRAACNLAAVNYHFGNKHNLYLEVFRSRCLPRAKKVHNDFKKTVSAFTSPSPADIIQTLAAVFLGGAMTDEERFQQSQLVSRELAEPTEAFEIMANGAFKPLFEDVLICLQAALPHRIVPEKMVLSVSSIFSMIIHFNFARPMISLATGHVYDDDFKSKLIDHITDFALHGLSRETI